MKEEPRSKEAMKKSASLPHKLSFQGAVVDWMTLARKRSYRGPVVLDLSFTPGAANPPSIEKLPKSYLDLLENRLRPDGSPGGKLLYINDRNVKVLFVRYNLGLGHSGPRIQVQADSLRNFAADIELVKRIHHQDFRREGYEYRRSQACEQKLFDDDASDECLAELLTDLREFERWSPEHRVRLGKGYEAMHKFQIQRIQKEWLRSTDRFIDSVMAGTLSLWSRKSCTDDVCDLVEMQRGFLLANPFTFSVMHAPRREGESERFREALEETLAAFKSAHPVLFPLTTQLGVTIFHVPPLNPALGTDLDNIARRIIPGVQQMFQPPSTFWRTLDVSASAPAHVKDWAEKGAQAAKRLPNVAVTTYRAIELPRADGDPADGLVSVAFGDGQRTSSMWYDVDQFLDRWESTID